jgi:hypothetical protein
MQRQPDERLARDQAREVCVRQGLRGWVTGSIAQLGQRYALTLEALDTRSGEALAYLGLARAAALHGDSTQARQAYQSFFV